MSKNRYQIYMDGDKWCATTAEFVDMQKSDIAFGETPLAALESFLVMEQKAESEHVFVLDDGHVFVSGDGDAVDSRFCKKCGHYMTHKFHRRILPL